jgi:hypothetical protein
MPSWLDKSSDYASFKNYLGGPFFPSDLADASKCLSKISPTKPRKQMWDGWIWVNYNISQT